jgi:hypothetical protein
MIVDTGKNTKKQMFPFTSQILEGCKPVCQETLTETFSLNAGEELWGKEPELRAEENTI